MSEQVDPNALVTVREARLKDPFLIEGPAMISFSGGRTSGYMLWRILQAHGGTLPADVICCFANTGREREETLQFVREIETRWSVPIVWLEYASDREMGLPHAKGLDAERGSYRVVTFETASRDGKPFESLIYQKHDRPDTTPPYLPNSFTRQCTYYLKLHCFKAYLWDRFHLPFGDWTNVIGFRADEPLRYAKIAARNTEGEDNVCPLYEASVTKGDVLAFWESQPFRLNLRDWESNCKTCFLKGRKIRRRILQDHPEDAAWDMAQEEKVGGTFDKISMRTLLHQALTMAPIPDEEVERDITIPCTCTD